MKTPEIVTFTMPQFVPEFEAYLRNNKITFERSQHGTLVYYLSTTKAKAKMVDSWINGFWHALSNVERLHGLTLTK